MSTSLVTCPECQAPLRLPQATPEGRVRCPKCKAVFAPVVEGEEAISESVAVVLDDPRDPDRSFFERLAGADDPFAPAAQFEVIAEAESVPQEPRPEPARPKRPREPEPELAPQSSGNRVAVAIVALITLVFIGGIAGASYVAYRLLARDESLNTAGTTKPEGAAEARIPEDSAAKVKAATVHVRTMFPDGQSTSSAGFFVPGSGFILTNARSVGQGPKKTPALKIIVTTGSRTLAGRILAADSELDLALLQVAGLDLPEPLTMNADTFTVREPMPLVVFTASDGEVAHSNVTVAGSKSVTGTRAWLLLNGPLPRAAWGGPVTDTSGKVVGVSGVLSDGASIAVPVESAWAFIQTAARSAESGGGIAFATADTGKRSRDDWDDGQFPNPWRPGRMPPMAPPGWDAFPQPMLPLPGFEPNLPRFPGGRERR